MPVIATRRPARGQLAGATAAIAPWSGIRNLRRRRIGDVAQIVRRLLRMARQTRLAARRSVTAVSGRARCVRTHGPFAEAAPFGTPGRQNQAWDRFNSISRATTKINVASLPSASRICAAHALIARRLLCNHQCRDHTDAIFVAEVEGESVRGFIEPGRHGYCGVRQLPHRRQFFKFAVEVAVQRHAGVRSRRHFVREQPASSAIDAQPDQPLFT